MKELNIYEVMETIPHRYPFLLIDKVIRCEPNKSIEAVKNITVNEPCFQGHFPGRPVFPGVLVTEALAQSTGILSFESMEGNPHENYLFMLVGIDNARFKRQVIPGDVLMLRAEITRKSRHVWKFATRATVDGKVVCSADIIGAMTPR